MFSCGMDSLILKELFHFKNEECLFIKMQTPENRIEEQFIDKFFPGALKINMPLNSFTLHNNIIPFRNHFLALTGAQVAQEIFFGFTAGDTTKDKDFVFKAQMEGILNYFSQDLDKVKLPGPYSIQMPFKERTKRNLVQEYVFKGHSISSLLENSCSCYSGKEKPCGECRSCLRKFVALSRPGINLKDHFAVWPGEVLHAFYKESIAKNRKQELKDIQECINQVQQ